MEFEDAVIVALGGNLPGRFGSSAAALKTAVGRLAERGLKPIKLSSLWASSAWPDQSQPPYLNAVALVETALSPEVALAELKALEADFGTRDGERNAARVLDLDLIAFGRLASRADALSLPHPRAAERLFVMGPLAEIAPGWRHPVLGETAANLALRAQVGRDARPVEVAYP